MADLLALGHLIKRVQTRDEFVAFVKALAEAVATEPDELAHSSIEEYLSAVSAWVDGMDRSLSHIGEEIPSDMNWRMMAMVMFAGTIYE